MGLFYTRQEFKVELVNISDYNLYIYTVNGEEVPFTILQSSNNSSSLKLTNTQISQGTYFITIAHKESGLKISKAIVVH